MTTRRRRSRQTLPANTGTITDFRNMSRLNDLAMTQSTKPLSEERALILVQSVAHVEGPVNHLVNQLLGKQCYRMDA